MLANVKEILEDCKKNKTAIGAFNISNLETAQAVIWAAVAKRKPIIVQITKSTLDYAGNHEIVDLVSSMIEHRSGSIPVGIHLDHGKTFEICKEAIELGFNSVMLDGSHLSFEENKSLTKRVADYAHKHNVSVQGELGTVPYLGRHTYNDDENIWEKYMTNPEQAAEFAAETGIDSLAVAIGNAHGFQKEKDVPDWERLQKVAAKTNLPLILHGASDWNSAKIRMAIERGVTCFNVDTDIRVAFVNKLCNHFESGCTMEDPRKVMGLVREAIQQKVEHKIAMFSTKYSDE